MALKITQTQRQTQRLILTPYLKQVLHIFLLPVMELREFLEEKITENPLLEKVEEKIGEEDEQELPEDKPIDDFLQLQDNLDEYRAGNKKATSDEEEQRRRFKESLPTKAPTLQEHLLRQLRLLRASSLLEDKIGEFIIGNIDNNGYLQIEIEEAAQRLKVDTETIENILSIIQRFDPPGVGARNLKECLLIQLEQKPNPNPLTTRIVKEHLSELKNKRYAAIARKLKLSLDPSLKMNRKVYPLGLEEVKRAKDEILKLEPKPGRMFGEEKTSYTIPDLTLRRVKDGYEVILNDEELPQLKISQRYKRLLTDKKTLLTTKKYLKDKLTHALNLIKAVEQRQQTLKQVTEEIIKVQREFLERGTAYFKPLTIRQLARMVRKSESTVSRVIANKHIQTSSGIVELKKFFSSAIKKENGVISAEKVKGKIKELISAENSLTPLSDAKISYLLAKEGVSISRRTVTKYRKSLKIPSSYQRR